MMTVLETTLPADAAAVAAARHALNVLLDKVSQDTLASLRLAVSELVTNGVRHGGAGSELSEQVAMTVRLNQDTVRVEVYDSGQGFDIECEAKDPGFDSIGGRGLFIVEALAERWGVEDNGRNCVWAEFAKGQLAVA